MNVKSMRADTTCGGYCTTYKQARRGSVSVWLAFLREGVWDCMISSALRTDIVQNHVDSTMRYRYDELTVIHPL